MTMQGRFVQITKELIARDERVVLMLNGIGRYSFRESMKSYPERAFDIGILEQTAIGAASGLSAEGFIPVLHTWAPFLVERPYEQLKLDFGYQKLGGNFVSVGASFDLMDYGYTHFCPADVGVLKLIPNMQVIVPGAEDEFEGLYRSGYANGSPTYFRLSAQQNNVNLPVEFGKAYLYKKGAKATVIAVGPMLDVVIRVLGDEDITILYYTTVKPFDIKTFENNFVNERVLICEPYFRGGVASDIILALSTKPVRLVLFGVPHELPVKYGTYYENQMELNMSDDVLKKTYSQLIS